MSVIERYHWHVSDEVEFKKLHREFFDQYLKRAGAKEMLMNQESSGSWLNYQVDVIFEDWSGKNALDFRFKKYFCSECIRIAQMKNAQKIHYSSKLEYFPNRSRMFLF